MRQNGAAAEQKKLLSQLLPQKKDVIMLFGDNRAVLKSFADWKKKVIETPHLWLLFSADDAKFVTHFVFYHDLKRHPNTAHFHSKISPDIPVIRGRVHFSKRRFSKTNLYAYVNGFWVVIDQACRLSADELSKLKDRRVKSK